MSLEEVKIILDKFEIIQSKLNLKSNLYGITISGGECTLNPYFFDIIEYVLKKFEKVKILTNLVNLKDDFLCFYKKHKNKLIIQVSIDGLEETHNKIRGMGTYQKSFNNIKTLLNNDINVSVMFTSNNLNYKEFNDVYNIMYALGIDDISCQRYINQYNEFLRPLNYEESFIYYKQLLNKSYKRPPMFIDSCDNVYNCIIGRSFLVHESGNMLVCRNIPIVYANAITDNIDSIITAMKIARIKYSIIPKECISCYKSFQCIGGAKCLVYAERKNFNTKDILCNIKENY
jgi:sulfatase maturation enzyme AslB (radical SAM superfamily)